MINTYIKENYRMKVFIKLINLIMIKNTSQNILL